MKAVTDANITSMHADTRRKSFDYANELMSLANVDILIEGFLFENIRERLNEDHIKFFESAYRIDDSVKEQTGFNFSKAICWIAKSESKSRKVIIISDNVDMYREVIGDKIKVVSPQEFITLCKLMIDFYGKKDFISLDDAINFVFFTFR